MGTGQGKPADLVKDWTPRDWMVVGGGFVAFIFSLFDYVGVSASFDGIHESVSFSAWHGYAILGLLLIFATAVTWALRAFGTITLPPLPARFEHIAAGASGLGTLLVLLRGVTYSSPFPGISVGLRFGGIVLILAGCVVTAGAFWAASAGSAISSGSTTRS